MINKGSEWYTEFRHDFAMMKEALYSKEQILKAANLPGKHGDKIIF